MPRLPDRPLRQTALGGWLRENCTGDFPSYYQLRAAGYAGIYRTELDGKRIVIPPDQIPRVIAHFRLVPSDQLADAAD
jgi:hypothetical protein